MGRLEDPHLSLNFPFIWPSSHTVRTPRAAGRESLLVFDHYTETKWSGGPQETLGMPWAICLATFAACTLGVDAHFTWHRYKLGRQIAEQRVPAWQDLLSRIYIWFFVVLPWLLMNILAQINARDLRFYDGLHVLYNFGAALLIVDLPLHILWSITMFVLFLRSMDTLRQVRHVGHHQELFPPSPGGPAQRCTNTRTNTSYTCTHFAASRRASVAGRHLSPLASFESRLSPVGRLCDHQVSPCGDDPLQSLPPISDHSSPRPLVRIQPSVWFSTSTAG